MATKKYDDSCLIFDAEFMEHLCSPSSIKNYEEALANFVLLINKLHTGNIILMSGNSVFLQTLNNNTID
jgi:hypothetical protein